MKGFLPKTSPALSFSGSLVIIISDNTMMLSGINYPHWFMQRLFLPIYDLHSKESLKDKTDLINRYSISAFTR